MTVYDLAERRARHRSLLKRRQSLREIFADTTRSDLERVVLGITGDEKLQEEYEAIEASVLDHVGEPIVKVETSDPYSTRIIGGVILGGLNVQHSPGDTYASGEQPGEGCAGVIISVPTQSRLVAYAGNTDPDQVRVVSDGSRVPPCIEILYLGRRESSNNTFDPSKDYSVRRTPLLIGNVAIEEVATFSACLRQFLEEVHR